jgi:hypothetical protein
MTSEWMKVMLEEIARKKADAEQAKIEQRRRDEEKACPTPPQCVPAPKQG